MIELLVGYLWLMGGVVTFMFLDGNVDLGKNRALATGFIAFWPIVLGAIAVLAFVQTVMERTR